MTSSCTGPLWWEHRFPVDSPHKGPVILPYLPFWVQRTGPKLGPAPLSVRQRTPQGRWGTESDRRNFPWIECLEPVKNTSWALVNTLKPRRYWCAPLAPRNAHIAAPKPNLHLIKIFTPAPPSTCSAPPCTTSLTSQHRNWAHLSAPHYSVPHPRCAMHAPPCTSRDYSNVTMGTIASQITGN